MFMKMKQRFGFTMTELLCVIAILALLAAILMPVVMRSRESGRKVSCTSSMRQIWTAMRMYVDDHDGNWPDYEAWGSRRWYLPKMGITLCPSVSQSELQKVTSLQGLPGYAYTAQMAFFRRRVGNDIVTDPKRRVNDNHIVHPTTTVVLSETPVMQPINSGGHSAKDVDNYHLRHNGGSNYVFVDGHLKWYRREQVHEAGYPPGNDGTFPTFSVYERM